MPLTAAVPDRLGQGRAAAFVLACVAAASPLPHQPAVGQGTAKQPCEVIEVAIPPPAGVETPDEKAARLERAFLASLQAYDRCQAELSRESAGGGGGASGAGGGGGGGGGAGASSAERATSGGGGRSTASGSATGTEDSALSKANSTPNDAAAPAGSAAQRGSQIDTSQPGANSGRDVARTDGAAGSRTASGGGVMANDATNSVSGAIPGDIPSGHDDDIVAQQIREAAMNETDPAVREKLWDDYRKYKGLPPR